jgi:hypothetical protein
MPYDRFIIIIIIVVVVVVVVVDEINGDDVVSKFYQSNIYAYLILKRWNLHIHFNRTVPV